MIITLYRITGYVHVTFRPDRSKSFLTGSSPVTDQFYNSCRRRGFVGPLLGDSLSPSTRPPRQQRQRSTCGFGWHVVDCSRFNWQGAVRRFPHRCAILLEKHRHPQSRPSIKDSAPVHRCPIGFLVWFLYMRGATKRHAMLQNVARDKKNDQNDHLIGVGGS